MTGTGIRAHCLTHGPGSPGLPDPLRDPAVGPGFADGDLRRSPPDRLLKGRICDEVQGQVKQDLLAREILLEKNNGLSTVEPTVLARFYCTDARLADSALVSSRSTAFLLFFGRTILQIP